MPVCTRMDLSHEGTISQPSADGSHIAVRMKDSLLVLARVESRMVFTVPSRSLHLCAGVSCLMSGIVSSKATAPLAKPQ
ncbi:MAG: hypothetical protein NZS48_06140 [Gemmata sp.]|nr:hypothetical protein [Gemmata sp.]